MAFVSLIHWHAIGTLEQATKDNDHAIQAVATTLRAIWLHQGLRYSMTPVGLKPNPIKLSASKLVGDQLRTSFELASVIEFGFNALISDDYC